MLFPRLPEKLSALVRHATVSSFDADSEDEAVFTALKEDIARLYPRVHAVLRREEPSERALLFTWDGADKSLDPVMLCAHFDVVPAQDAETWTHGPFSGDIVDGELWGRGTQDIKQCLASILEAAETLLEEGFCPRRTVYFAFGGDEEAGGRRGARAIAALLEDRGIRLSFLVDEGGPIAIGILPFIKALPALIGVAEKGYVDFRIDTEGAGGHASMPPAATAAGRLAAAVAAVEAQPAPLRLTKTVRAFLKALAPEARQPYNFLFNNLWASAPLLKFAFSKEATTNAMLRTTTAPTMLGGSPKENVLAEKAWATINTRLLPGDNSRAALQRLQCIVTRFGATVSIFRPEYVIEPSLESTTEHEGWHAVKRALKTSHPEVLPVPFLFTAATDTKHYRDICGAMYRFTPLRQTSADLARVHASNERIALEDLDRCALFFKSLLTAI